MLKVEIGGHGSEATVIIQGNIKTICCDVLVMLDSIYESLHQQDELAGMIFREFIQFIPDAPFCQGETKCISIDLRAAKDGGEING